MEILFKQCEDWVIALWRDPFQVARIKLTAIYGVILSIIVVGFSVILYQSIRFNIFVIADQDLASISFRYVFVENALMHLRTKIIFVDVVVVGVTTIFSYFLARYTLRPIELMLAAQQKFTENASHELRTPLAIMRSDIEILLRGESPAKEEVTRTLTSTIDEIKNLSTLADDLLTLARAERGRLEKELVPLKPMLERVVTTLGSIASERKVQLSAVTPEIAINAQPVTLERIFMNLAHNAITHTNEGGTVTLIIVLKEKTVEVRVSDTGQGIKIEDQPHIFERFYKGSTSQGTGLGLAIVAELVAAHKGRVWLESSGEAGTTFVVSLPKA